MPKHTEIEPNVDLIDYEGRSFFIIGTAHVSKDSAELVEKIIRERDPDTVAVELCESRFESLSNPERWKETDIYTVILCQYLDITGLNIQADQCRFVA